MEEQKFSEIRARLESMAKEDGEMATREIERVEKYFKYGYGQDMSATWKEKLKETQITYFTHRHIVYVNAINETYKLFCERFNISYEPIKLSLPKD